MPAVASISLPVIGFYDSNGRPAYNGKVYAYLSGTTTLATTYQEATGSVANTNPIVLNERGECVIWYDTSLTYDLAPQLANGTELPRQIGLNTAASAGGVTEAGIVAALTYLPTSPAYVTTAINNIPGGVAFTAGGTFDASRSMLSKARDVYHARDSGVVGDGTTDDTVAFGHAMSDATALGKVLSISGLTIKTAPFVVPTALRGIRGDGRKNAKLVFKTGTYAANLALVGATGTTGFTLRDLAIDASDASLSATTTINLSTGNNCSVRHVDILGCGNTGILHNDATDIVSEDVTITTTGTGYHVGVYGNVVTLGAYRYVADHVILLGGFDYGIQFGGDNVHVSTGHVIRNCNLVCTIGRTSSAFGFSLVACNHSHIRGCYSQDTGHEGFQLSDCFFCSIDNWYAAWTSTNGADFASSIEGSGVAGASSQHCQITNGFAVNAFSAICAIANNSRNCVASNLAGKDCSVRGGGAVIACYTDTSGVACGGNVFQGIKHVNEAGAVGNYYLESPGGGSTVTGNAVLNCVFDGALTGTAYSGLSSTSKVFDPRNPASGGAITVFDEGVSLTTAATSLNFVGGGVTATQTAGAVSVAIPSPTWTTYTPTVTAAGGVSAINSAAYAVVGNLGFVQFDISLNGNSSGGLTVSVPNTSTTIYNGTVTAANVAAPYHQLVGRVFNGVISFTKYDGTSPMVDAVPRYVCSGVYKIGP